MPIDGEYVKEAKIGRAIMDADIIISLTHFKGHEATGFGGAIKNIGMAAVPVQVKWISTAPENHMYAADFCVGCGYVYKSSVPIVRSPLMNARQRSIMKNVSDVKMRRCLSERCSHTGIF